MVAIAISLKSLLPELSLTFAPVIGIVALMGLGVISLAPQLRSVKNLIGSAFEPLREIGFRFVKFFRS